MGCVCGKDEAESSSVGELNATVPQDAAEDGDKCSEEAGKEVPQDGGAAEGEEKEEGGEKEGSGADRASEADQESSGLSSSDSTASSTSAAELPTPSPAPAPAPGKPATMESKREWAAKRVCRLLTRKRVENLVFGMVLQELDIQEERELNASGDEMDAREGESGAHLAFEDDGAVVRYGEVVQSLLADTKPVLPDVLTTMRILNRAAHLLRGLRTAEEIDVPAAGRVIVVGDLHGQLADLKLIFERFLFPDQNNVYLFNGDFVDRGEQGVEVLLVLLCLKLHHPDLIHLNRGNHEDEKANCKYGFDKECSRKYNLAAFRAAQRVFQALPLCHIVAGKAFVTHGGLPEFSDVCIQEIQAIDRFRRVPGGGSRRAMLSRPEKIFQGLLWSDPRDQAEEWVPSNRGAGVFFGESIVDGFLSRNGLEMVIRSHQTVSKGFRHNHSGKTTTVFSASRYCGKDTNKGSCLLLTKRADKSLALRYEVWETAVPITPSAPLRPPRLKDDVLARLRAIIFARQPELLTRFQELDTNETGTLERHLWVEAMGCMGNLPWNYLAPHLCKFEDDGSIAYIGFLERFQNRLAQRWLRSWSESMMPHIVMRIAQSGKDLVKVFKEMDKDKSALVSYHEFTRFLLHRQHTPALDPRVIYYLLREQIDTSKDGFISPAEFNAAFSARAEALKGTEYDTEIVRLWEARALDRELYNGFIGTFREAEEEHGAKGKGLPKKVFVSLALRHFGGSQSCWQRTASLALRDGRVRWKYIQRRVKDLSALHSKAVSTMDLLRGIARARVALHQLFVALDKGSGFIAKHDFFEGLRRLHSGNARAAILEELWKFIDTDSDDRVSYQEFFDALNVYDTMAPESASYAKAAAPAPPKAG